jgi:arylsulfatase A-like enzyme
MEPRPNILLLMTDQQRFDTIAAAGHPHMITPNLDRLVREGCIFQHAYTPNPICVPARYHALTGTTVRHHGFSMNTQTPMNPCVPTLPGLLSDAGYETRAIGKMHFQPPRRHHGFDRMELSEETPRTRESDEYAMYLKSVGLGHIQNIHGLRNLLYEAPQRSLVPEEHHGTTWVGDRTVDFLKSNGGRQPFFCWTSWIAPHPPFDLPDSVADLYRDVPLPEPIQDKTEPNEFTRVMSDDNTIPPDGKRAEFMRRRQEAYYAQITFVDQQVGRVLDALEEIGQLDNTLIIFTSDHGEMLGDHGSHQKAQPYDSCSRIPFIVRYPARITPGMIRDDFADLNDILPTALDVAGVTHPQPETLPGGSIFDDSKDRSTQYLTLGRHGRRWATIRDKGYKYTYYYGLSQGELFDMENDPNETTNLLITRPDAPEVIAARDRLHQLVTEHEAQWGIEGETLDENGELRTYDTPDHGPPGHAISIRARQFPKFPAMIADAKERASMNTFAEEALDATRDEPLSALSRFDLASWGDQGATDDFLARLSKDHQG